MTAQPKMPTAARSAVLAVLGHVLAIAGALLGLAAAWSAVVPGDPTPTWWLGGGAIALGLAAVAIRRSPARVMSVAIGMGALGVALEFAFIVVLDSVMGFATGVAGA